MSPREPLQVGRSYEIETASEGAVGEVHVDAITPKGTIRGALTLRRKEAGPTETELTLRRLADAAEQLSFAVMAAEEERLLDESFAISDRSTGIRLLLGRDVEAIYVDPTVSRLSFRIRAQSDPGASE